MPKQAKVMTPKAAKERIRNSLRRGKLDLITAEDLDLAEQLDPNIRKKVEGRMQGIQLEPQQAQIKSNLASPSRAPNNSPNSPSPVKANEASSSNRVGEEKARLSKKGKEYHEFVEKRLGPFVELLLWLVVFGDYQKAEWYAPTPEECKELAPHVARIAPKVEEWLHVPQVVHDLIVTSDDTFSLAYLVVKYMQRTGLLEKVLPRVVRTMHRRPAEGEHHGVVAQEQRTNGHQSTGSPISSEEWAFYGVGAQYQ